MRETKCFEFNEYNANAVVFLNLKKAFDTVDHDILLSKMNFYRIQGTALDWFTSYSSNGTPQCLVSGSLCRICSLKCIWYHSAYLFFGGSLSFSIG